MNKKVIGALAAACVFLFPAEGADRQTERDALIAAAAECCTEAQARAVIERAETAAPSGAALVRGITSHNLAIGDPARWADPAVETLRDCAGTGDPVALCYYGSALTIRAGLLSGKGDIAGATAALQEGFGKMDAAVKADPNSPLLRFLRAENAVSVSESSPFPRWDVAETDAAAIEKTGSELAAADRARLETIRGRIALGRGDAAEAMRRFETAIRTSPKSPAAATARRFMEDFEE